METIRSALRAATAEAHERLDAVSKEIDLSEPETYRLFLQAQSGPVVALEDALEAGNVIRVVPDWPMRSRRAALVHDLEALHAPVRDTQPTSFQSAPEMLGAVYVLEGSRLGARFLIRRILDAAPELQDATEFLRHGEGTRLWPTFLTLLETEVGAHDLAPCISGATKAFEMFEASFAESFHDGTAPGLRPHAG